MSGPDFIPDDQFVPDPPPKAAAAPAGSSPDFIPDDQFQPDSEKYGSLGQQALTVGEGLGKGLAGPLFTGAERLASAAGVPGISPADQAGREAVNPYLHGGAEAAGFIAPAVASFGATGEARAAIEGASALTQSGVLGKIGEGAAAIAGVGGEGASTISKIAAGGIKTGAEMAALQAGDETSKLINQDPNQSLGTAAANIGLAGILGGAAGAGIGAVSPLFKATMEKAGVPRLIDDAKAQYDFRQSLPDGDVPTAITNELSTRLDEAQNMRSQMSELKGDPLARAMPEVTPENTAKIDGQVQDIASSMTKSIEKASDNAYLKGAVPKLAQDFQDFLQVVTDPNATYVDKFDAIDELKRAQQAKGKYNLTAEDTALGTFTKGAARDLRLALEDAKVWGDAANVQAKVNAATKASIDAEKDSLSKFATKSAVEGGHVVDPNKVASLVSQSVKGKAGLKTNAINNYLENTQGLADTINKIHTDAGLDAPIRLTPTPALDHTLGRSSAGTMLGNWLYDKGAAAVAGHVGSEVVGAGLGSLVGHPEMGALIGDRLLGPTFTAIAKPLMESASQSAALKGSIDYVANVVKGGKLLSQAAANLFKSGSEVLSSHLIPDAASRSALEQSLQFASNPNHAMTVGQGLGHYMPDHATAAAAMSQTAVNYFNGLKPKQVQAGPLDKPGPIDKNQLAIYNRQLDIAQQPLLALKYAKSGTLLPQDLKTINTIYPGLGQKMASQAFEEMTKAVAAGHAVPFKQRQSLSMLMGRPLDSNLTQPAMMAVTISNAQKAPLQTQGPQRKPSKASASSMEKSASAYQTPEQSRTAARTAK